MALAVIVGVASRRDPAFPDAVTSYHGRIAQDGIMPGPGPDGVPSILFDVQLQGTTDNLSVPLVRDDVVFVADLRGQVTARAASDLAELWTVDGPGPGSHAPVLLGPTLVVAAEDGTIIGLDAATGARAWESSIDGAVAAPLAGVDDRVLVGSTDGELVILSSVDGAVVGRIDTHGPVKRSPAIADGIAYVAADSGVVTAVDVAGGEALWRLDLTDADVTPVPSPEVSTPVYADDALYLVRGPFNAETAHEVVAIDLAEQAVRWRATSPTLATHRSRGS